MWILMNTTPPTRSFAAIDRSSASSRRDRRHRAASLGAQRPSLRADEGWRVRRWPHHARSGTAFDSGGHPTNLLTIKPAGGDARHLNRESLGPVLGSKRLADGHFGARSSAPHPGFGRSDGTRRVVEQGAPDHLSHRASLGNVCSRTDSDGVSRGQAQTPRGWRHDRNVCNRSRLL